MQLQSPRPQPRPVVPSPTDPVLVTTGVQHISSVVGKYYVSRGTRALSRADVALLDNGALALAAAEQDWLAAWTHSCFFSELGAASTEAGSCTHERCTSLNVDSFSFLTSGFVFGCIRHYAMAIC